MAQNIVTINVTENVAADPSILQQKGALLTQGGTNTAAETVTLLNELSDLTAILAPAKTLTSLTFSAGTATGTTTAPHGWGSGDVIEVTIADAVPSGYNGTFAATVTGTSTFTYAVADPGTSPAGTPGTVILAAVAELTDMATTFFAQGNTAAVYVLELGEGEPADGVTALGGFIDENPGVFYSYLVPREWDNVSAFLTFVATFEALDAKTYFFVTTTTGHYASYTALMKSVFALIESPDAPATEFSCAAPFYKSLNYDPSSTNKVTPMAFSYLFSVTPYPPAGNSTLFAALKAANINVIGTGSEGGITNSVLFWGTMADGNDFTYWYSVDWAQINADQALANEVINGSNDPAAPLYYNQDGINRLQARAQQVMNQGVSFGLVLAPITVTAVPFSTYVADHPSDYQSGTYTGIAVTYTPSRGFKAITFNINVSNFPAT